MLSQRAAARSSVLLNLAATLASPFGSGQPRSRLAKSVGRDIERRYLFAF